jgi:putative RecB family exonuclease
MALPLPRSLSPSKVSKFTACPLSFRYSYIDRYPEPPSAAMVKGTLVHAALEGLIWHHPPGQRTPEVALDELTRAWDALREDPASEWAALELTDAGAAAFIDEARKLITNYFALEDPNEVRTVGVELGLEADIGGVRLRGIIDRLDVMPDGSLVVVDYKTGRAPGEGFERSNLVGVHVYAILCEQVLGIAPSEVRLLHLREPVSIVAVPTAQSLRGHRQRSSAVYKAIERACATEDFRPRTSGLCGHCHFRSMCPAVGGELPTATPVALAS